MEKPLWNTGNGNPASGWENRCPGQTPRIVASRSLLIRRVLGIVPGFFIDFECAQVCNLRRRPENLWLKVILSLPGDMDVTGDSEKSRNRSTGDKTSKPPEKTMKETVDPQIIEQLKHLFPREIPTNIARFRKLFNADGRRAFAVAALFAGICQSATSATLCVNPGGTSGCYSMIGAAVMKAHADFILDGTIDTINVAPGIYMEDVIIETPLSLVGAGRGQSIINAVGLSNGIYINGFTIPGLSRVVVTGFTIENANFEGILVTNASFVTISDNEVINNNRSLNISTLKCPGQPAFETNEDFDCGEGIHLIGVDHSAVVNNTSEKNSGGILLSDETGATHHNLIIGNLVRDNPFDCGITLASHSPAPPPYSTLTSPPGIYSNTIAKNESVHNGLQVPGAGAGVGLFAPGPGNKVYSNVVIGNELKDNGLPGVAFHNHASFPPPAPPVNLNDNVIVANRISGNGADTDDAATPGPTGINVFGLASITGTVITGNVIDDEAVDIATKTPAQVNVHLNDLLGEKIGVDNLNTAGTVDATENWWGSPGGPGVEEATSVSGPGVFFTPWLRHPILKVSPPEDGEQGNQGNQGDGGQNNAEQ